MGQEQNMLELSHCNHLCSPKSLYASLSLFLSVSKYFQSFTINMVTMKSIVLAASSLVSLTKASPLEPRAAEYRSYKGDGTIAQGWPAVSTWANFDSLYASMSYMADHN